MWWYLIFAETIPAPNWTGMVTGGCLGSFVTAVGFVTLTIYLARKDKKPKSEGIPFEVIATLGDAHKPS